MDTKLTLGICSLFRDSVSWHGRKTGQLDRYFAQLVGQKLNIPDKEIGVFALENDSIDDTLQQLRKKQESMPQLHIFNTHYESGVIKSVVSANTPKRLRALGLLGSSMLTIVRQRCKNIIWLESDLVIDNPNLFASLLEQAIKLQAMVGPIPLIKVNNVDLFYDTWGYINMDGTHWTNNYRIPPNRLLEMKSIGTCAVLPTAVLESSADFNDLAFQGLCATTRAAGIKIFTDTRLRIYHPSSQFIAGRWV